MPTLILLFLLLPVSVMQGLWLRRVATRLPGAEGERHGQLGEGEPLHLLAIGDSIIDGVGTGGTDASLPVHFARHWSEQSGRAVHWHIEGESGRDIAELLRRLDRLNDIPPPDRVLISIGVNDVTGLTSRRRWRQRLRELLSSCFERWPETRVIFCGLPPMDAFPLLPQPLRATLGFRAASLDAEAARVIAGYDRATHVPTRLDPADHEFCEDGFHPSAESCNLWARELVNMQKGGGNT